MIVGLLWIIKCFVSRLPLHTTKNEQFELNPVAMLNDSDVNPAYGMVLKRDENSKEEKAEEHEYDYIPFYSNY